MKAHMSIVWSVIWRHCQSRHAEVPRLCMDACVGVHLQGFTQHHTRRLVAEGLLPFRPAAYGVHNLWRRKKLLLARAHSLPGYKEARTI